VAAGEGVVAEDVAIGTVGNTNLEELVEVAAALTSLAILGAIASTIFGAISSTLSLSTLLLTVLDSFRAGLSVAEVFLVLVAVGSLTDAAGELGAESSLAREATLTSNSFRCLSTFSSKAASEIPIYSICIRYINQYNLSNRRRKRNLERTSYSLVNCLSIHFRSSRMASKH
jgi:hypothetical protein